MPLVIEFVRFDGAKDNAPKPDCVADWPALAQLLTAHVRRAQKDGAAWSPVRYAPGATRGNAGVQAITVAVFDVDHLTLEQARAMGKGLEESPFAFAVHSTHTHAPPQDCRFRVALPLKESITPSDWPRLRSRLIELLNLPADPGVKDPARLYYLPSCAGEVKPFAVWRDGLKIDAKAISSSASPVVQPPQDLFDTTINLDELRAIVKRKATDRRSKPEKKEIFRRIVEGEPLAPYGEHDTTINRAVSLLVANLPPSTPDSAIISILSPSLAGLDWAEGWDHLIGEVRLKLERARPRIEALRAENKAREIEILAAFGEESALADDPSPDSPDDPKGGPYTDAEIDEFAASQKCTRDQFNRRWIIQAGPTYYVFVAGRYRTPIPRESLAVSLRRDLARAPTVKEICNAKGEPRPAKPPEILDRHATVARQIEASLILRASLYDATTQTFHEAICPPRSLTPRADAQIQRWLELLGGDQASKLLDWVATVARLDRQSCALYLQGERGTGKTLLPTGLARIWTTGAPTDIKSVVLSDFNSAIASCPLILADEEIPKSRHESSTSILRTLIGTSERRLARKYMPDATIRGAVRLVITANNDRLLQGDEDLTSEDLDAVASRFLHVRIGDEPRKFLESIGGPPIIQARWIDGDMIARHAIYLAETRKVDEGKRFLVEGETTDLHAQLATSSGITPQICEWLCGYLANPAPVDRTPEGTGIRIGNGKMRVATGAITRHWSQYVRASHEPSPERVGRALRSISTGSDRHRHGDQQFRVHLVRPDLVLGWAKRNLIGDVDAMRARIEAPL